MPSVPDIKVYSARDGASKPIVIYQPSANYTEQASKARLEGPVVLRIVVKNDGTVGDVELLHGLGMGLDEAAVAAVRAWRFQPGLKDGKPVAVRMEATQNFILRH